MKATSRQDPKRDRPEDQHEEGRQRDCKQWRHRRILAQGQALEYIALAEHRPSVHAESDQHYCKQADGVRTERHWTRCEPGSQHGDSDANSSLTAAIGPSCHFAVTRRVRHFWSEADIEPGLQSGFIIVPNARNICGSGCQLSSPLHQNRVTISDNTGRGRSAFGLAVFPIWMKPMIFSFAFTPSPPSTSRSKANQPVSQQAP